MSKDAAPLGKSLTRGRKASVRNVSRSCASLHGATNARQRPAVATGGMVSARGANREDRWAHIAELCRDLGNGCGCLLRTDARRSLAARDSRRRCGDRSQLGTRGTTRKKERRDAPIIQGNAEGRRTRIAAAVPAKVAQWLRRVVHVHAQLCHTVGLYGDPKRAGGSGLEGDSYAARAAEGDSSILDDTLCRAIEELTSIRDEVWEEMGNVPPSRCIPGSAAKIAELQRRCSLGKALHHKDDLRN
jgi:hypothetical protein